MQVGCNDLSVNRWQVPASFFLLFLLENLIQAAVLAVTFHTYAPHLSSFMLLTVCFSVHYGVSMVPRLASGNRRSCGLTHITNVLIHLIGSLCGSIDSGTRNTVSVLLFKIKCL